MPSPTVLMLRIYPDVRVRLHAEAVPEENEGRREAHERPAGTGVGYVVGARTGGKDLDRLGRSLKALYGTDEFTDVVVAARAQVGEHAAGRRHAGRRRTPTGPTTSRTSWPGSDGWWARTDVGVGPVGHVLADPAQADRRAGRSDGRLGPHPEDADLAVGPDDPVLRGERATSAH